MRWWIGPFAATLAGCGSVAPIASPSPEVCVPVLRPADFPPVAVRDRLVDLRVGDVREIRAGDTLLFGLRLEQGDERTDMVVELTAIGDSRTAEESEGALTLTMTLGDGEQRLFVSKGLFAALRFQRVGGDHEFSTVRLPADFLCHGLDRVCRLTERYREIEAARAGPDPVELTLAELDESLQGLATLLSMLRLVQGQEQLNQLLESMISFGDMISVAMAGGLTTVGEFDQVAPSAAVAGLELPAWCVPISVDAGSRSLIHAHLLVTEPRQPFALTGGLIAMRATRAGDPSQRLSLVLIGARRGSG